MAPPVLSPAFAGASVGAPLVAFLSVRQFRCPFEIVAEPGLALRRVDVRPFCDARHLRRRARNDAVRTDALFLVSTRSGPPCPYGSAVSLRPFKNPSPGRVTRSSAPRRPP